MPELMLVGNPHKRKGRRTAAQKAATRKMLAARWGTHRKRKRNPTSHKRRKNPWYGHATAHSHAAKKGWRHRRRSPARHYRRRHNPSTRGLMHNITGAIMPAAFGALGTLGVDVIMGKLPLPDMMKTGNMRHLSRALGVVGLSLVAPMIPGVSASAASGFISSGFAITLYQAAKEMMKAQFPNLVTLDGLGWSGDQSVLGYYGPQYQGLGYYGPQYQGLGYPGAGWNPDETEGLLSAYEDQSVFGGDEYSDEIDL